MLEEAREMNAPEVVREDYTPSARCMIAGPTGAGKTCLLLAMNRACVLPADDHYALSFQPADRDSEKLLAEAADFAFEYKLPAQTLDSVNYRFRTELIRKRGGRWRRWLEKITSLAPSWLRYVSAEPPLESALLEVVDTPGGELMPVRRGELQNEELLGKARRSQWLILCINAAEPYLDSLTMTVPTLFSRVRGEEPRASFDRVLLLLTQVDRIAERFVDGWRAALEDKRPARGSQLAVLENALTNPQQICQVIDPVSFAYNVIGPEIVNTIWQNLPDGAKLGIGICSSCGFEATTGSPFAGEDPFLRRNPGFAKEGGWLRWRPFGVREALYFILNGERARDRRIGPIAEFVKDNRLNLSFHAATKIFSEENL
jgi:hypothetical protein